MNSPTLDVLLDIELPVTIRFGSRQMTFGDILNLNAGSLVEFERAPEDPVEVLVNDRVVARGEVVMVQGSYGVRITEILSRRERLDADSGAAPETAGNI